MKEPRSANQAGSREESVRPGTSPEPAPAQAVLEDLNDPADISSREVGGRLWEDRLPEVASALGPGVALFHDKPVGPETQ